MRRACRSVLVPVMSAMALRCTREVRRLHVGLLAVLAVHVLLGGSLHAAPTLEEIRDEYQASLDRIGAVWLKFRQVRTSNNEVLSSSDMELNYEAECEYAADGPRELMLRRSVKVPERTPYGRPIVSGCDGRTKWQQVFGSREATDPFVVWLRPRDEQDGQFYKTEFANWTHWSILGLHMNYRNHSLGAETLPSLLYKAVNPQIAEDLIDGAAVWRVEFEPLKSETDPYPVSVTAWFDPAAGFLPKRIDVVSGRPEKSEEIINPALAIRTTAREVKSFAEFPEGVWFPTVWSETFITYSGEMLVETETTVAECKVNAAVERTLFAPRIPQGVKVVRGADRMQVAKRLRSFRQSSRDDEQPVAAARSPRHSPQRAGLAVAPSVGDSLIATPPRSREWLWLLASSLFLAAGLGIWKFRQRDRSTVG